MKFTELSLQEELMKGIQRAGFVECMPVQEKVLPVALQGKDVMVQSKTGSGKTAVFILSILNTHLQSMNEGTIPLAMIIAPTRELAVQIEEDARILSCGIPQYRIGCFYGGVGYARQDKQISEGVDLIIGTPGRILDYQKMGKIDFSKIFTFVIDEADRLFDMGFYPDIQKMFRMLVEREKRQTMLFSATLGSRVKNLAWDYMNNPVEIEVQPEEITVKAITQELYHTSKDEKFLLFLRLIAQEKPENALIFTNTKAKAVELSKRLNINGYTTQYLMGDLPQRKRLQVINRMKRGELKFLIATDVAARGLQIDDLSLVVNYDIPEDYESYVHRIGRTARAGKSGKAITLACEQYVYGLEAIEQYIQMKIPVLWPQENFLSDIEDKSASMKFRDLVNEQEYASKPIKNSRPQGRGKEGHRRKRSSQQISRVPHHDQKKVKRSQSSLSSQKERKPIPPREETINKKSYAEIQKMDFDQRMAYYKHAYGGNKPEQKKKPEEKSSHQKKGRKITPQVIDNTPESKKETLPMKKKHPLSALARLFRRKDSDA